MEKKPPLPGQEEEHEDPDQETQKLGRRERSNPGESAGSGTAVVTLPQDEPRHGCEGSIAGEGLPACRGGVQLSEAVALWFAPPSQVVRDAYDEYREERQRPQSSPTPISTSALSTSSCTFSTASAA